MKREHIIKFLNKELEKLAKTGKRTVVAVQKYARKDDADIAQLRLKEEPTIKTLQPKRKA